MRIFSTAGDSDNRLPIYPIRVLRLQNGEEKYVRLLSDGKYGLFYHFIRGTAIYCPGVKCPPADHKQTRHWRGYLAVEYYVDVPKPHWVPAVLEITQHLDQLWREVRRRGQVWLLTKDPGPKRRKNPLKAIFSEQLDCDTLPLAFDIMPVIQNLYSVVEIDLTSDNPLPVLLGLQGSEGKTPHDPRRTSDNEQHEVARAPAGFLREKLKQMGMPLRTPPKTAEG
jgi:hypothetical protein